jgi:hypothetical protein
MKSTLKRYFILAGVPQEYRDGKWYKAEKAVRMFEALQKIEESSSIEEVKRLVKEALATQELEEE